VCARTAAANRRLSIQTNGADYTSTACEGARETERERESVYTAA